MKIVVLSRLWKLTSNFWLGKCLNLYFQYQFSSINTLLPFQWTWEWVNSGVGCSQLEGTFKNYSQGTQQISWLGCIFSWWGFLASLSFNEICIWCTKVIFKVNYFVIVIIFTAKHFCIKTWDKIHQVTISAQQEEDQDPVLSWTSNGMLAVTKKDREVFLFHLLFFLTVL